MESTIRRINENDLNEVANLYTLFWNEKMNLSKMKEKFTEISTNSNYIILVAETNGKVSGTIQGIICEELYGECLPFLVMENFVVAENTRGKGIGRKLLTELEKIGKASGCTQILFITETERKDTIRFYEKLGFNSVSHKGFKKILK
jgi:ribosomal protein S18 acetylase RimI-like enzyme